MTELIKCHNFKRCGKYAKYLVYLFGGKQKIYVCEECVEEYKRAPKVVSLEELNCPLCKALKRETDNIFHRDLFFTVMRTKDLKGHKERIMIVLNSHKSTVSRQELEHAINILTEVGKEAFHYTPKFIIMDGTYATIKNHWHLVATDLYPFSHDFKQILKTKWLKVVDVYET